MKIKLLLVLGFLLGSAILVASFGTPDPEVNLNSLVDLWSDTLRDTDQIGMKLTRVNDAEEMKIGSELARGVTGVGSVTDSERLTRIGQTIAPHLRRHGIEYQFHVIDLPAMNAFALPGGQIFVLRGLLEFLESDAELAAVLGHEMSHVDLRHCIERYQYETRLKKAGAPELGWLVETAHRFITLGFSPEQELEADAQGQRVSAEAGYARGAEIALFERMKTKLGERARIQSATPAGEVAQATGEAIGSYFQTHPRWEERVRRLKQQEGQK